MRNLCGPATARALAARHSHPGVAGILLPGNAAQGLLPAGLACLADTGAVGLCHPDRQRDFIGAVLSALLHQGELSGSAGTGTGPGLLLLPVHRALSSCSGQMRFPPNHLVSV